METTEQLNKYSMDKAVDLVVEELKENTEKHYLHKTRKVHTPDSRLSFNVPEELFTECDDGRFKQIARYFLDSQCLCYGMHNGRVVFKIKDYFVAASPSDWACKFNVEKINSKGVMKVCELNADRKDKLAKTIAEYGGYVSEQIKMTLGAKQDELSPKYYFFDTVECSNIENNGIYTRIKHYYNDELNAMDVRTNTPLAESYFMMIGWLFNPEDKSLRMAGCFECSTSSIGKTSFIEQLCKRTEVVHGIMSQNNGRANQFSFSSCFVEGPDIVTIDDPCQGTSDILNEVSGVVSNRRTQVELKSKDRYHLTDVSSRFYISTNVPLYMRNDTNNFLSKKIFVLKVNDVGDGKEHISSSIASYISYCNKKEVDEFLSYCVSMYQTNKEQFLAAHLGLYIDKVATSNLFADMLNEIQVKNNDCKTLINAVLNGRQEYDREWNDELLKNWNKLTKFIKDTYPDIAAKTVCGVPSNNRIYVPGRRPGPERFKNYMLTAELRKIVLRHIKEGQEIQPGVTDDADDELKIFNGNYDDLICGNSSNSKDPLMFD